MNPYGTVRPSRKYHASGARPHIGFLVFPGFDPEQFGGSFEAFRLAGETESLRLTVMSLDGGEIENATGEAVMTRPVTADGLDTLLVVGGETIPRLPELADFVRAASAILRRIAGIGAGVLVMAEAGLLNGRRAAIGAQYASQLARAYPAIRFNGGRTFINDGNLWSASGAASGVEMCLALIEQDWGPEICRAIAPCLPGIPGKSQYAPPPAETLSPAKSERRARAEIARRQVQNGRDSFTTIAHAAGFKDAEEMRRQFLRFFGQPPQVLRRTARMIQKTRDRNSGFPWRAAANGRHHGLA
jgi:transcriptional regulator GlxA family with amidase domain